MHVLKHFTYQHKLALNLQPKKKTVRGFELPFYTSDAFLRKIFFAVFRYIKLHNSYLNVEINIQTANSTF